MRSSKTVSCQANVVLSLEFRMLFEEKNKYLCKYIAVFIGDGDTVYQSDIVLKDDLVYLP